MGLVGELLCASKLECSGMTNRFISKTRISHTHLCVTNKSLNIILVDKPRYLSRNSNSNFYAQGRKRSG